MKKYLIFLVIIFSSVLLFWDLGNNALTDYDEATYGHVVNETLKSGQFITLKHSVSGNWFEKPPLYFWLAMLSQKIFPNPEFALRLPSAIFGLLSIIFTTLIAFNLSKSRNLATISGAILATTPVFIEASRQIRLDAPVVASILFAFFCFLKRSEKSRWLLGVGIGAGIGFLFKSVIGFFVFPFIILWSLIHNDWKWLKNFYFWLGIALMIIILAPWHIYESMKFGAIFWNEYIFKHILRRFSQNVIGGATPYSEYFKFFILLSFPWIVLFFAEIIKIIQHFKETKKNLLGFAAIAFFTFVIFSAAQTKLVYYLLPMFPFVAIALALFWENIFCKNTEKTQKLLIVGLFATLIVSSTNTIYAISHKHEQLRINQIVANEEKEVGLMLAKNKTEIKIYTFGYPYHETIRYYSEGKTLNEIKSEQALTESFFVIMSRPFFDASSFPTTLVKRLKPVFVGKSIILLRFD